MVLSEAARSLIFTWSCVRGETQGCQLPRGRETHGDDSGAGASRTNHGGNLDLHPPGTWGTSQGHNGGLGDYKPEGRLPSTKRRPSRVASLRNGELQTTVAL